MRLSLQVFGVEAHVRPRVRHPGEWNPALLRLMTFGTILTSPRQPDRRGSLRSDGRIGRGASPPRGAAHRSQLGTDLPAGGSVGAGRRISVESGGGPVSGHLLVNRTLRIVPRGGCPDAGDRPRRATASSPGT